MCIYTHTHTYIPTVSIASVDGCEILHRQLRWLKPCISWEKTSITSARIITTPPDVAPEIDLKPELRILSCGHYSLPRCSWKGRKETRYAWTARDPQ